MSPQDAFGGTGAVDTERVGEELSAGQKAAILVEALPYIRRFAGKIVVIKHGGAAGEEPAHLAGFAEDVVLMRAVGMQPVVVHGGGPQIGALMNRLGMETRFIDGLRVTDAATLDVARMVLVGKVNRDMVGAINMHAPIAVGLSGEDAKLIVARQHSSELGYVGAVHRVEPDIVQRLLAGGLVPVIATIGSGDEGQAYNINADAVAGALAEALQAEKLVFLTDVEGILAGTGGQPELLHRLSCLQLRQLIDSGVVRGGMLPKAQACLAAVNGGVGHAHILDGRKAHALLLEFFTREGVGTMVEP